MFDSFSLFTKHVVSVFMSSFLFSVTLYYFSSSLFLVILLCFSEDRQHEKGDQSEEEGILGSDDDEQEDPHDYVKGELVLLQCRICRI